MIKAPGFDGTQACATMPGDKFFPDSAEQEIQALKEIKVICNACKFQVPCLQYSLENAVWGIWAGTTEKERKRMRSKKNIVAKRLMTASNVGGR